MLIIMCNQVGSLKKQKKMHKEATYVRMYTMYVSSSSVAVSARWKMEWLRGKYAAECHVSLETMLKRMQ